MDSVGTHIQERYNSQRSQYKQTVIDGESIKQDNISAQSIKKKMFTDRQSPELKHICEIKGKITSNVLVSEKEKQTQQQTDRCTWRISFVQYDCCM